MTGRHSETSKQNFTLMREQILGQQGKNYWRSLEELVDAPEFEEFVKGEFPQHAEEWTTDPTSRRNFLKIMGASLALAGLSSACVIQPPESVIPYVRQPEEIVPGKALFYATAFTLGGVAQALLARSNEGRPTKLEGNPEHPTSLGATNVFSQASLLSMYDPDRSQEINYRNDARSWDRFVADIHAALEDRRKDGGAGIRFLTETVTSPTLKAQFRQILTELPNARWYQYEPLNRDNALAGAKAAFGENVNTIYKFENADRILSLDSDFLASYEVVYTKGFAEKRAFYKAAEHPTNDEREGGEKLESGGAMNRLYAVEVTPTLTGAKADHTLTIKPSQFEGFAKAVAKALGVNGANSTYTENAPWISAMAADLLAYKGKSIVIPGAHQSPVIHALAHAMNAALDNVGKTVIYTEPLDATGLGDRAGEGKTQIEGLRELVRDIDSGAVQMLVILGGNPAYNTPADLKFNLERLNKVPLRAHLSLYNDETSEICQWHINQTHFLEEWSDALASDGTVTMIQPLIEPLYGGRSMHDVVQIFAKEGSEKSGRDVVKEYWQKTGLNAKPQTAAPIAAAANNAANTPQVVRTTAQTGTQTAAAPKNFDDAWRKAIHDGFVTGTALPPKTVSLKGDWINQSANVPAGNLEVVILPEPSIYDGRFANNGWLQELPNPLTKTTWDNIALISPKTARNLNLNQNRPYSNDSGAEEDTAFVGSHGGNLSSDLVTLKVNGQSISKPLPVWIQPGQPDDVVTIHLGYGRTSAGRVGNGIGFNAYEVRKSDALTFGVGELTKTGQKYELAATQTHFNMEGRDILRVWDFNDFENAAKHGEQENNKDKSIYPGENHQQQYDLNHRWGMTIDLNACVGCNACVIACQAENNIPVVGKEQVQRSREMQWLRIDAYYGGSSADAAEGPQFQPLLCQQCEQAPCETVCPVHATVHSAEGLNDMVYNRCVGTRYCSNNCPYKVRRFNFLLYQDWNTPQYKLMRNPEVSVRSRGVMEKCTYCTQRIAAARIEAQKDGARKVRDGEIVTACQAACPADAIIFGDINDINSRVSKLKRDQRNYNLLNDLNTQPRTTYLAGLKNQNRAMPDYKVKPQTEGKSEANHG